MKTSLLKHLTRLLTAVLGVLGFASCNGTGYWGMTGEYGCPRADFDISGRVVNEADEPIEGIEVKILRNRYEASSDTTDDSGEYAIHTYDFPNDSVIVVATDIDGEANGSYASDTIRMKAEYVGGDGHWYEGTCTGVVNFKLKTVEPETSEDDENIEE